MKVTRATLTILSTACLLAILLPLGCAQQDALGPADPPIVDPADPIGSQFAEAILIGPIEGFTSGWHALSPDRALLVPKGADIQLQCKLPDDCQAQWTGAIAQDSSDKHNVAAFSSAELGSFEVAVEFRLAPDGGVKQYRGRLQVVDVVPSDLQLAAAHLPTRTSNLSGLITNEETMERFFGESIAEIVEVAPGHFRTSTGTAVSVSASLLNPRLPALLAWNIGENELELGSALEVSLPIEWRVDGVGIALGSATQISLDRPGNHEISVGPPAFAQRLRLDTYDVRITSHTRGVDFIEDGVKTLFRAETTPRGFENEIVWLSSTMYGLATPTTGRGATFEVTFQRTMSSTQWLGVKANAEKLSQDVVNDPQECPASKMECVTVGGTATSGNLSVTFTGVVPGRIHGTMSRIGGGTLADPEYSLYNCRTGVWLANSVGFEIGFNDAWGINGITCVTGHEIVVYIGAWTSPTRWDMVCATFTCP